MIVASFRVEGLFGIIDADLELKPDLSVIVGRNGSGKTSILSLLSNFMHLDYDSIRATKFKSAIAVLQHGSDTITVASSNDGEGAFLSIQWGPRLAKISLADDLPPRASLRRYSPSSLAAFYGVNSAAEVTEAMQSWQETSREFKKLSRLTFVRLDRTVVAVTPQGDETRDEAATAFRTLPGQRPAAKDPIDLVIEATRDRFFRNRRELSKIRYEAYRALMQLHFTPVKPATKKGNIEDLERKLKELRLRVSKSQFAKELGKQEEYFKSLDTLMGQAKKTPTQRKPGRKTSAEESLQFMLETSEQQIEGLLKIFDAEQERVTAAEQEINTYIHSLERFLAESGKRLWFSDDRYELAFYVPAIGETPEGEGRSLKTLSSGERQIVIVLTYLAFLSGPDSIFVIDEPELSLHIRWQGYLMNALNKLRPKGGQIIIATHAPEIAGRAPSSCIQLRQKHMPVVAESDNEE
jgi:predicted ATPase